MNIKFKDLLNYKEIEVPGTKIILTVKSISWPDFMESLEIEDVVKRGAFRLTKVIQEWNLVDDSDKKIEINEENMAKLPADIMMPIVEATKDFFGKKKTITEKK